jgi:diguanylate cyclase (GGDEF)-like protein
VLAGSFALVAFWVTYCVASALLPPESLAVAAVSDFGLLVLEAAVIVLCWLAFRSNKGRGDRWMWVLIGLSALGNAFGDGVWTYFEVLRRVEVETPGLTDIGYLSSYPLVIAVVFVTAWKVSGRLKALETTLDAMMFTIGAAALTWPLLLAPLLRSDPGPGYWVDLAYPLCDLLIVMAFASYFLGSIGARRTRPRPYFLALCFALLCQVIADSAYFAIANRGGEYLAGGWLDMLWSLGFAVAGVAAVIAIRAGKEPSAETAGAESRLGPSRRPSFASSHWRALIPYLALPVIGGMLAMQLLGDGWHWDLDTEVLAYLGFALVALLVCRQYVTLAQNRRLNVDLVHTSQELEGKVDDLADLNARLEVLNSQAHRLNSLRELSDVADGGLELACSFAKSPGGWISLRDGEGKESVAVTRGPVDEHHPGESRENAADVAKGTLLAVPLEIRDESLGTIWLLKPAQNGQGPNLLPVIAAHVATAIDNAQRYEEAMHLAERDALTGLFNHRGIHKRLAGETLRAQKGGSELSLIMMDLDDFKLLNDTYGHPAGDSVLRQVSDAIRSVLRHADLAGRVGGDELLLVLPNTGAEGAQQLSQRLRDTLAARPYVTPEGQSIPVRLSLGVATYPGDAQSLGQLIETADANLYASKQRGGNTITGSPARAEAEINTQGLLGVAGKLLDVVGARDHYTRRHSEQVIVYALSLGEALRLSEDSLNTLHLAAMLHDVGKIAVPEGLLRKPALLSAEEEDMVRRHVDMSAAVISEMPRLAQVVEAVAAHHERHDGGGYPAEVSGDDIPLLGRILAVADAYSAMILDRPYRKSLTREQARAELLKAAGTQLDPELVRRFVQILDAREARLTDTHAQAG